METNITWYAAWRMNCLAEALQMAGTVMTQRMSSITICVDDWLLSSFSAWSLKNRSACENRVIAANGRPLLARIVVSWFKSCQMNSSVLIKIKPTTTICSNFTAEKVSTFRAERFTDFQLLVDFQLHLKRNYT